MHMQMIGRVGVRRVMMISDGSGKGEAWDKGHGV